MYIIINTSLLGGKPYMIVIIRQTHDLRYYIKSWVNIKTNNNKVYGQWWGGGSFCALAPLCVSPCSYIIFIII